MNQEKRVILAFALSFAVLMLWSLLFKRLAPPPPRTAPSAPAALPARPAPEAKEARPPAPVQLPIMQGGKAQEIVVEGDLYRVVLDTRGAVVKSWILKKYRDEKENPLDIVNRPACESLGFPMSLGVADAELSKELNTALYVAKPGNGSLNAPASLEFVYSDGKVQAQKKFFFGPGYEIHAEASVFDGQHYLPLEVAWPGGFGDHSLPPALAALSDQAVYQKASASGVTHDNLMPSFFSRFSSSLAGAPQKGSQAEISGPLTLAGLEDLYFAAVFLPDHQDEVFRADRQVWTPSDWKGKDSEKPKPLLGWLGTPQPKPLAFRLFLGPKDLDVLRTVNPPLDRLVDFGWFSIIAKPLFLALRYVYEHWAHNWGWAIVILTVLINLLMFPLKLKSIRSAQEMQKIAPQVKIIQEKYKQYKFNDPRKQRMNQEVMKLYQEHGINPLGGCLPMALQLPFLYAFYNVLRHAIELRHAPWIWCVRDLSMPDKCHLLGIPLPVLPTLIIVTTFILQKMTPMATADPGQQRMMLIMPLVFGFIFYNLAAGLVLYYLTANIVGVAQQAFINRRLPAPPTAPVPRKPSPAQE
jgi:YidC/Oxa1 family membrane protein insertase